MEELLNKLKELNVIRAVGDYEDYEPNGKHKDTIYFAEDEGKIYLNGKSYGGSDINLDELLEDYATKKELNSKVDKVDGKVLSSNDFTNENKTKLDNIEDGAQVNPTKVSELQNDLKYQTEAQLSNSLAILYESLDSQLVDEYTHLDNKKVDKVTGKQLSTEDFTTLLKQKLEGLTNYDDSTLTSELNALKSRLDTLVGSGDVTAVIDTFQEIEAFLQGVTNTQTLTGLLQEMKSEIVALCADTYVDKTSDQIIDGVKSFKQNVKMINERSFVGKINRNIEGGGGWIYAPFTAVGANEEALINVGIYGQHDILNYVFIGSSLSTSPYNLRIYPDGTAKAKKFAVYDGADSQFLKADGSVDSTAYLPTTSYTASDVLDKVKSVDGAGSGLDADLLDGKQAYSFAYYDSNIRSENSIFKTIGYAYKSNDNIWFNAGPAIGFGVENYYCLLQCMANINKLYLKSNNNGFFSDWREFAFTDSNVASADKLTTKQLTNEDLNDIKDVNFSVYHGTNCTNAPDIGADGFSLQVSSNGNQNILQVLTDLVTGFSYKRFYRITNNVWSNWKKMLTEDDIASLVSRIEALENQ